MELATNFQQSDSPPWPRRGGRDINKNVAKPPLLERTGRFNYRLIGGLNEPPRLRPLRRLRYFSYWAQRSHPALTKAGSCSLQRLGNSPGQGGELLAHNTCPYLGK